jgi:hypothetical protein
MKKISILLLITLILCVSCVSKTQQKGLDEVASLYKTETGFGKGFYTKDGKKYNYFEAVVANNKLIDSLGSDTTCPNMALILFNRFTDKEKKVYDYIRIKLKNKKDTLTFNYTPEVLTRGLVQAKIFDEFSKNLVNRDFNAIEKMVDTKYISAGFGKSLQEYFTAINSYHGNPKSYTRTNFGIAPQKNGERFFNYLGTLNYNDGYKKIYFINVPLKTNDKKIKGYNFLSDK